MRDTKKYLGLLQARNYARSKELERRMDHELYKRVLSLTEDEVCQFLGRALGYPWYCDDQKNFPGATPDDGVCVGEHVAETIAAEAALEIYNLRARVTALEQALDSVRAERNQLRGSRCMCT